MLNNLNVTRISQKNLISIYFKQTNKPSRIFYESPSSKLGILTLAEWNELGSALLYEHKMGIEKNFH